MKLFGPDQLQDTWKKVCEDPRFQDCPYKVELSATGKIMMSPANNLHSQAQSFVMRVIWTALPDGYVFPEYALQTREGIRAPDVVWCSQDWLSRHGGEEVASEAPEICVEIMSACNTLTEMDEKRSLYFEKGCREFILVDRKRFVTFHTADGQLEASALVPDFPARISLPGDVQG